MIKRIRYIDKLKRSGIQDRKLLNCSFEIDESPHSKYSKAFKRYCDKWEQISKDNIGLMLFGNVGTGKSFYAGVHSKRSLENKKGMGENES